MMEPAKSFGDCSIFRMATVPLGMRAERKAVDRIAGGHFLRMWVCLQKPGAAQDIDRE